MDKKSIFITSHNGRIKCILKDLFGWDISTIKPESKGFANCSVIKIYNNDNYFYFDLIYEGEPESKSEGESASKSESKYLTFKQFKNLDGYELTKGIKATSTDKLNNLPLGEVKDIYLIRHGEGYHNVSKLKKFLTDPKLTKKGILQAYKCGKELQKKLNLNETYFFSSILYRTIQTMGLVMLGMDIPTNKSITVLDNNHEITKEEFKQDKCNAPYKKSKLTGENNSSIFKKTLKHEYPHIFFKGGDLVPLGSRHTDKYDKSTNLNTLISGNLTNYDPNVGYVSLPYKINLDLLNFQDSETKKKNFIQLAILEAIKTTLKSSEEQQKIELQKNLNSLLGQSGGLMKLINKIKKQKREKEYLKKLENTPELKDRLLLLLGNEITIQ